MRLFQSLKKYCNKKEVAVKGCTVKDSFKIVFIARPIAPQAAIKESK
jgi:hypothetical protein